MNKFIISNNLKLLLIIYELLKNYYLFNLLRLIILFYINNRIYEIIFIFIITGYISILFKIFIYYLLYSYFSI